MIRRLRLLKAGVVGFGTLVAVSVMILSQPSEVSAKNPFLGDFTTEYPAADGSRIDVCALCHVSGGYDRNSYGQAWAGNNKNFAAIENLDSDGDGATNIEEIRALTFPGDRSDSPPATTTTTTTAPPTTSTTTTTTTTTTTAPTTNTTPPTPRTEPGRDGRVEAKGALSGELVTAAAAESLAQSGHAATAPSGDRDGVSPLTVVFVTLILSAVAYGLLMLGGRRSTGRI